MDKIVNTASCIKIFDLAAHANHDQIKSLNRKERKVVAEIANSILKDQDLPHLDLSLCEKIKLKLKPGELLEKKETVLGFFQKFFHIQPSSKDIENKVKNVERHINQALEETTRKIDEIKKKQYALEAEIEAKDDCLLIYQQLLDMCNPTKVEDFTKPLHQLQNDLVRQLEKMRSFLIKARQNLAEHEPEIARRGVFTDPAMAHRIYEDTQMISEKKTIIQRALPQDISIHKELETFHKHFSKRIEKEEKKLNDLKATLQTKNSELEHLLEAKTFCSGIAKFNVSIDSMRNEIADNIKKLNEKASHEVDEAVRQNLQNQAQELVRIFSLLGEN